MKSKIWGCLLLSGWLIAAGAQEAAPSPDALDVTTERQRLGQERAEHEARYLQAERVCYSRFAVSDCLRDARKARRLALDELRREELILNDLERQNKAIAALKRIEDKLADQQKALQAPASPDAPR